jgi:dihydrofolate synthase / folylpolyglutamate synthase
VPAEAKPVEAILAAYDRFGIDLGLERIQQILATLGHPEQAVPIIHVTGTNGKGSVCAYLSSILMAAGYRVGRFTSPHLVDWTERVVVNGQPIPEPELVRSLQQVEAAMAATKVALTQFELLTAAAWWYFAQASLDVLVIEVGLGGRLDATNVCPHPLVSVITSISLDHWQRLGSTLGAIAFEKAGIIKAQRPVVLGPLSPEAEQVIKAKAQEMDAPIIATAPGEWVRSPEAGMPTALFSGQELPMPLAGDVQLVNGAIAVATIQALRAQGWSISDAAMGEGMAKTQWPGRLQWVDWQGIPLLIDGAHNPASAQALRDYVDEVLPQRGYHSVHWLMGMLAVKDHCQILTALLREGDRLTLIPIQGHTGAEPEALAEMARSLCPGLADCTAVDSLAMGLARISTESLFVLCGSLYLVGEFFQARIQKYSNSSDRVSS